MNVFVLCTGRCGSTTFARACEHIQNYTASHQTRDFNTVGIIDYPNNHIEVDNKLSYFLGRLEKKYGDSAYYVHLKRSKEDTASSFARRYDFGIIKAYKSHVLPVKEDAPKMKVCRHYWETINSNIEMFLKGKSKKMTFHLETAEKDFQRFWSEIGAEGNLEAAINEWGHEYNASRKDGNTGSISGKSLSRTPLRLLKKVGRIIVKFPRFVSEA